MSTHVLSKLLSELGKSDKNARLSLFCNKFEKVNNTGARMLSFIYHMTLK